MGSCTRSESRYHQERMLGAVAVHLFLLMKRIRIIENSNSTNNARSKIRGPRGVEKRICEFRCTGWSSITNHQRSHFLLFLKITVSKNSVRSQIRGFLKEIWPINWSVGILVSGRVFPGQIDAAVFKNHLSRAIGAVEQGVLGKLRENGKMPLEWLEPI